VSARTWIWPAYWVAGTVLLGLLLWVSHDLLDANRNAKYESDLRAALWRMDSRVGILLARERERDPQEYLALATIRQQTYTKSGMQAIQKDEILRQSPLIGFKPDSVRLHFQIAQDGHISSPQVPTGTVQELTVPEVLSEQQLTANISVLDTVKQQVDAQQLGVDLQAAQSRSVRQNRGKGRQVLAEPSTTTAGNFEPMWIGENLYFVRKVKQDNVPMPQGFVIDWPRLRDSLLEEINDLFPGAALMPYPGGQSDTRALFTLPARLEPGAMATGIEVGPEHTALGLLWLLVVGSFIAYGRTLQRAERQKRFASHVTHELRSPLTTFSLYSDLLAEGLVTDPIKREEYLQTLRSESERMGHMIENVIAQARLEEGRARLLIEQATLGRVLDEVRPALEHCCSRNAMTLSIELGDAADAALSVDRPAVGRILTNLVENACKYGRRGDEGLLAITAEVRNGSVRIRVRDHGPGIAPDMVRRIFRAFDRGGRDETDPMRGLGLGLPLSRELARRMGGELTYESPPDGGALFVVTLPVAS